MHQSFEERKQDRGGLNLAEPRASETSSVVGALLCGHLSVCMCVCVGKNTGSARLQMMQKDVFLNIISLCCNYTSRWAFGCRRTDN